MYFSAKSLLLIAVFMFGGICASAQCPVMPTGFLCISQEAANQAAINAKENAALKNQIDALKASVTERDKSIEQLKETNRQNVFDLTDRLHKTEVEMARLAGELIGEKAQNVSNRAIIEVLMKYARKKSIGLIAF